VFPAGPLAVLDAGSQGLTAYLTAGTPLPCPADTLTDLGHWALNAGLGQPRLATHGRPSDPLVVLSPSASPTSGCPPNSPTPPRYAFPPATPRSPPYAEPDGH
jgi:hypothetical protein